MVGINVRASILTDTGRRRQVNEDWCGSLKPGQQDEACRGWLWLIADGVGAYGTGQEASSTAGAAILRAVGQAKSEEPLTRLRLAIEAGNRAVWERRRSYSRQGQSRPVLTTVLAVELLGENAFVAHVGDCRAYLIRRGEISQITRDHTWVGEQVSQGKLSAADARLHPRRHVITRALGQHESIEMDLLQQSLEPGDRLVLCSDGLTNHLQDQEICDLASSSEPGKATRALIRLANARGGDDNITVAVIELAAAPVPVALPETVQPHSAPESLHEQLDAPVSTLTSFPISASARGPAGSSRVPARTASPAPLELAESLTSAVLARPDYLSTLYTIGQRISASLDLDETLNAVMDSVVQVTRGERGFIMLLDEATGELVCAVDRAPAGTENKSTTFSRNIVQSVFQQGKPIRIGDALADSDFNQYDSVVIQGLRSVLCAPLEVKGKRTGVVYVENRTSAGVFSEADLDLLSAFAAQAAIALENARLHDQLRGRLAEIATMRTSQENVLRSINSAIISLDAEGRVLVFNRLAEELFDSRFEAAHHRRLEEILPAQVHRALGAVAAGLGDEAADLPEALQLEARLPHRGRLFLSVRALPLADASSRRTGTVLIIDDLTQQRLLDEARQREVAEKERVKALFGRYLAPAVVEQLIEQPEALRLGGVRTEVTVLFADIRGFTGISERHTPEEVVSILNSYLSCATEVILGLGGTLDKFMGDGVMAFFNAPLAQSDHVMAAARAATEMQSRLRQLQGPGGSRIAFGVGINTGEGIVGNIGTAELMNYTVIGDVVNVAARLQGEARAGEVLLSEAAYQRISELVEAEELGSMHVKGRVEPVHIFKVLRIRD